MTDEQLKRMEEEMGKDATLPHVVMHNVLDMLANGKPLFQVDDYLLDEECCTQDQREDITEAIYAIEHTTP